MKATAKATYTQNLMLEKKWFEEWFDSPWYHVLYAHRSEAEAETFIRQLVTHLHISPGSAVLDVACGKGRHAKTLASLGLQVTGIDLSCNSIHAAKKYEHSQLHFEVWDMRKVYRPLSFDYVLNMFSSFGYFESDQQDESAIQAMHDNLKPGGRLVLDYLNTEFAVKHMKPRQIIPRQEAQFHITKWVDKGFIRKKIAFLANGEHHTYEEQLKIINRTRFTEMLEKAGFQVEEILGDYELQPFNSSTSPRLILIARRND